ncbi:MAG: hypothetical protein GKR93_11845 [Gammaproteobacteria bacterium]|nr:hypothetical protein [Gammaproteobacteria bacterium]
MEELPIERQFRNVDQARSNLNSELSNLKDSCNEKGYHVNSDNLVQVVTSLTSGIAEKGASSFPIKRLTSFAETMQVFLAEFDVFIMKMESQNYLEAQRQRYIRKEERRDIWILWTQKIVRWMLGILAAIVMYSSLVWVSEHWGFIKVPVRDLVKESQLSSDRSP